MTQSKLVNVFGASPKVLVIDYLLDNTLLDFHKSDIAENTGISRSTLNKFFNDLVKSNLIVKSRVIGRAQMYMVNRKNNLIKKLLEIDKTLTIKAAPQINA